MMTKSLKISKMAAHPRGFSRQVRSLGAAVTLQALLIPAGLGLAASAAAATGATTQAGAFSCSENGPLNVGGSGFGTLAKPFQANSPWNRRPVNPVFDTYQIPTSSYFPSVTEGQWSTGVFPAKDTDPPATIAGLGTGIGPKDSDMEIVRPITVPHWPANVIPASASDGHADIVDMSTGVIHSFWQLRKVDNQWRASLYSWSCINGKGFADPAHYYQGARATGVAPMAGLIRTAELADSKDHFEHALTMSLTHNALSAGPTYVQPATQADYDAAKTNSGKIPEGALMMLPPEFDTAGFKTPAIKKIAETLKLYGAYVTDRNTGTPFVFYVENGSNFTLNPKGWNSVAANELQVLRSAMRRVIKVDGWIDGEGNRAAKPAAPNLLSMRGAWTVQAGDKSRAGTFDTWKQAVVFPVAFSPITMKNQSNRALNGIVWAKPSTGDTMKFTAVTSGGASIRMQLLDNSTWGTLFDSGYLGNGQSKTFSWPSRGVAVVMWAVSGIGQPSAARATLINTTAEVSIW